MKYVTSDKNHNYYVDFDSLSLFIVHKINRITETVKMKFNDKDMQFKAKEVKYLVALSLCLPMYEQYLKNTAKREDAKKLFKSLSFDLNDDACRDFNSFG